MPAFYTSYEQASKVTVKLKIKSAREYRERYQQEEKKESSLNADVQKIGMTASKQRNELRYKAWSDLQS